MKGIGNAISNCFDKYQSDGNLNDNDANSITNAIFGPFYDIFLVLFTVIDCVSMLISPFTIIVGGLLAEVANFLVPIIVSAIGSGDSGDHGDSFGSENNMISILTTMWNFAGIDADESEEKGEADIINVVVSFIGFLFGLKQLKRLTPGTQQFFNNKGACIVSLFGFAIAAFSYAAMLIPGFEIGALILTAIGCAMAIGGAIIATLVEANSPVHTMFSIAVPILCWIGAGISIGLLIHQVTNFPN